MIKTRALTAADAPAASAIHQSSFETAWTAAQLHDHIERDLCIGLFEDSSLIGFAVLSVAADQADIITIAISPARRGEKLGAHILSALHQAAKDAGVRVIFLEVAIDNTAATALYKSLGYSAIGTRPAYYKRAHGRVAARTYRKDLS
ncbi:ribosomal protein S18-alanine N-acetyltransferase [Fretibacter rubidus]|uniref:ribosomal protein S18-alanine N-acetyltransferase n=1 Tax=Fretibacter rubidus TaxID=570162 RepID=UPI00352BA4A4